MMPLGRLSGAGRLLRHCQPAARGFSSSAAAAAAPAAATGPATVVDLSQERYRALVAQRLSSLDHPAGGSLFLLPWDKMRLRPEVTPGLLKTMQPYTPESPLPDLAQLAGQPALAKLGQRLVQDLQIHQVFMDVDEGDEYLPRSVTSAGADLPELLKERLGGSVPLQKVVAPEDLVNPIEKYWLDSDAVNLVLRDYKANQALSKTFMVDRRTRHGFRGQLEFRKFQSLDPSERPEQLQLESDWMVYHILDELVHTEQNMVGWERIRLRLRYKYALLARAMLDQAMKKLTETQASAPEGKNNLLLVARPLLIRELVRLSSDELRLPVTCLADYSLGGLPMATHKPRPTSLKEAKAVWNKPLYVPQEKPLTVRDHSTLLTNLESDPVHLMRHQWACFARLNRKEPLEGPPAGPSLKTRFRMKVAEIQARGGDA